MEVRAVGGRWLLGVGALKTFSIQGGISGPPSACSCAPNRIDVFAVGPAPRVALVVGRDELEPACAAAGSGCDPCRGRVRRVLGPGRVEVFAAKPRPAPPCGGGVNGTSGRPRRPAPAGCEPSRGRRRRRLRVTGQHRRLRGRAPATRRGGGTGTERCGPLGRAPGRREHSGRADRRRVARARAPRRVRRRRGQPSLALVEGPARAVGASRTSAATCLPRA